MENTASFKTELFQQCQHMVAQRMEVAEKEMRLAQASANEETKSSAGDKYETGRAMAQLERDKSAQALAEARKLKQVLDQIHPEKVETEVRLGSLVKTPKGWFFIAISLGKVTVQNTDCFVISPVAPVGKVMIGLKVGQEANFNGQVFKIEEIF